MLCRALSDLAKGSYGVCRAVALCKGTDIVWRACTWRERHRDSAAAHKLPSVLLRLGSPK